MQDLRDGFRGLVATPVVSIVAVLSLALGIGANTAIFSILDSLMLRTLPVREPQRLAVIGMGDQIVRSWTNPIWEAIRDRRDVVDGAFAWSTTRFNLSQGGVTNLVDGVWASGGYFQTLGVQAMLGRVFGDRDDTRGGGPDGPVAVISYGFWQRQFGGAADVVGRALTVERVTCTIIGVTPPEFTGIEVGRTFDVAIPLGTEPLVRGRESSLDRRSSWWLTVAVRLKPDQSFDTATTAVRGIQPAVRDTTLPQDWGESDKKSYLRDPFTLVPAATGTSALRRRYEQPLLTILVVVSLVLLIACANIANLLLARATARRHEMSVRRALGASRLRLSRQLLAESLMLSGAGALSGLVLAYWGSRLLVRQLSTATTTVFLDLPLDWRMLGFTVLVAIATAVLFGTAPAVRTASVEPNEALKERGRGVAGDGPLTLGSVLVVVQVALSLMLVVAAGLFMRTFSSLANLRLGFNQDPILIASLNAQRLQLDPPLRPALFERFRQAAAATPGVAGAAISVITPMSGSSWQFGVDGVDGVPVPPGPDATSVSVNLVSADWFSTYGMRMLAGRVVETTDTADSPKVMVVNEAFARKFLGGQNPVGHRIYQKGFPGRAPVERQIVGYVEDAVYRSLRDPIPPTMYVPIPQQQEPPSSMSLSVRAAGGPPALLTRSLAQALTGVNPDVAITFRPLADQVDAALTQERLVAMLSGFFGALALLLAGLGLYGVTSYAVNRRRAEIGIRMALGAAPGGVIAMVLRRVAMLVGAGVVVGGAVSWWAARFVTSLLYGLQPRDPGTLATAAIVLGAIGALAGWLPARRAARLDPARVLREG
jgi:putative ABC transport system permease protein